MPLFTLFSPDRQQHPELRVGLVGALIDLGILNGITRKSKAMSSLDNLRSESILYATIRVRMLEPHSALEQTRGKSALEVTVMQKQMLL